MKPARLATFIGTLIVILAVKRRIFKERDL